MKLLWLFCVLPAVLGKHGFGDSHLKYSEKCYQWNCINTKLGLPITLPPRELAEESYRSVLPSGPWQDVLGQVLDNCYENRTRRYENVCPGQALMHCVLDQMIDNCPEEYLRKNDTCSLIISQHGFSDMFSVSIYHDLDKNLPLDSRPQWYFEQMFGHKCCNLPEMFSSSVLKGCGFETFITYYTDEPSYQYGDGNITIHRAEPDQMQTHRPYVLPYDYTSGHVSSAHNRGGAIEVASRNQMSTLRPLVPRKRGFGDSHLKYSSKCYQWNCINTKLGLPITLPPRELAEESYRSVLPSGPWQDMLGQVLDNCYENRTRRYENVCPGQALMHCVLDQMIDNCPEEYLRKNDTCSLIISQHGFSDMFSVSIYHDLDKNLPLDSRPQWFFEQMFGHKCCNLPEMFSSSVLKGCGFEICIKYNDHTIDTWAGQFTLHTTAPMSSAQDRGDAIKVASLNPMPTPRPLLHTTAPISSAQDRGDAIKVASLNPMPTSRPLVHTTAPISSAQDRGDAIKVASLNSMPTSRPLESITVEPLDCCDMSGFIQPSWRSECGFRLNWKGDQRLVISNDSLTTEAPVTTTTVRADAPKDLMLLPHSCAQETCVFRNLGIVGNSGTVDIMAYKSMLENFTNAHPSWKKASARAFTKCVTRKGRDYQADCEINRVLACTLDVLTENCPFKKRSADTCRHNSLRNGCQISSSKLRPKNRREICLLPQLIHQDYLAECGLETLYKPEYVVVAEPKPRKHAWSSLNLCVDQMPSTTCVMDKMGILNKYKFMDYFKMKDRIRQFTSSQTEWSALLEIYMSAFINIPMYGEHCSSQKKLLNVVDAMLLTCPVSKRVNSSECAQIYQGMSPITPIDNQNVTKGKVDEMIRHYQHIYQESPRRHHIRDPVIRRPRPRIHHKKPVFYGLLDSKNSPKVNVINIKPSGITTNSPLVLLPVYLRDPNLDIATPFRQDPMLRSNRNSFVLQAISNAYSPLVSMTTVSSVSTTSENTPKLDNDRVNKIIPG